MTYQSISVQPISGALGAVVEGVDLSEDFDNATASDLHQALLDHCVIFFRDQHLTPEQHLRLGRRFGTLANLQSEIAAWSTDVNNTQRGVDWQMRISDARCKLKSLYPKIRL